MEAFIENGTDPKRLVELLKEMDEATRLDDILVPHESVKVTIQKLNNRTLWKAEAEKLDAEPGSIEGSGQKKLIRSLNRIYHYVRNSVNEATCILVMSGMKTTRTYDGKFQTHWVLIPPGQPYEASRGDGMPKFETASIILTSSELAYCLESGLALYDEVRDILYPIRECALPSIGKLLNCAGCFKFKSDYPLGSALVFAEKLANVKGVKMLSRNGSERFRPVIGICGGRYVLCSQKDMIAGAWEEINQQVNSLNYMPSTEKWAITEERTIVDIRLATCNLYYDFIIQLQAGDIPGTSLAVTAYAVFGEARVLLRKNSAYHWATYNESGGVKVLFEGIFQEIRAFSNWFGRLLSYTAPYDHKYLEKVFQCIGKKREREAKRKIAEAGLAQKKLTAADMYGRMVEATYFELPEKQAYVLTTAYYDLFKGLCKGDPHLVQPVSRKAC